MKEQNQDIVFEESEHEDSSQEAKKVSQKKHSESGSYTDSPKLDKLGGFSRLKSQQQLSRKMFAQRKNLVKSKTSAASDYEINIETIDEPEETKSHMVLQTHK